jgi:hypothetical protein
MLNSLSVQRFLQGRNPSDSRHVAKRLHAMGWIYRQNRSWVAHSAQIHAGRMEYKEAHYTDDDGHEVAKPYCHFTPKGLSRFAEILGAARNDLFELFA